MSNPTTVNPFNHLSKQELMCLESKHRDRLRELEIELSVVKNGLKMIQHNIRSEGESND